MTGPLMILLFFILMLLGLPVAFSLLIPAVWYFIAHDISLSLVAMRMTHSIFSFPFIAVPLFIWAGILLNKAGVSTRIFGTVNLVLGRVKGGTALVNVVASLIFSGMSGAALADIGGLGQIEIKAMDEVGYKRPFSAAVTAASATIGPVFPPSIPLILLGAALELPALRLLLGGALPGILMAGTLCLYIVYVAATKGLPLPKTEEKVSPKVIIRTLAINMPALFMPVILVAGFLGGVFSPTEAGVAAVLYAMFLGFVLYRELKPIEFWRSMITAGRDTASVLFIVASAAVFGYCLTIDGFGEMLSLFFIAVTDNPVIFMGMVAGLLLFVGMFMESISAMLLFAPMLMPSVRLLHVDPIHFGVLVVLCLMIGLITPPFGLSIFMLTRIAKLRYEELVRALVPFYIPLIATVVLVVIFPSLVTWVPSLYAK